MASLEASSDLSDRITFLSYARNTRSDMSYAKLVRKSWMRYEVTHDTTFLLKKLMTHLPYETTPYIAYLSIDSLANFII